jgi:hypothetical protein
MHRNRLRNSIIILAAAAMLGAVALVSTPASAHHMGGFRVGGFHHVAYRQHFFYARHPFFIRRHFALIGTPYWFDGGCWRVHRVWTYWGWRWRRVWVCG